MLPDVEQNYSFNYAPDPASVRHVIQDVLPSYTYPPDFPDGLTNNGKKCDDCDK